MCVAQAAVTALDGVGHLLHGNQVAPYGPGPSVDGIDIDTAGALKGSTPAQPTGVCQGG